MQDIASRENQSVHWCDKSSIGSNRRISDLEVLPRSIQVFHILRNRGLSLLHKFDDESRSSVARNVTFEHNFEFRTTWPRAMSSTGPCGQRQGGAGSRERKNKHGKYSSSAVDGRVTLQPEQALRVSF